MVIEMRGFCDKKEDWGLGSGDGCVCVFGRVEWPFLWSIPSVFLPAGLLYHTSKLSPNGDATLN